MEDSYDIKSTTKEIYNIIENLEYKLNNRVRYSSRDNSNRPRPFMNNYMDYNIPNQINQNQLNNKFNRNVSQPPELQMQSPLNEYYIRKIIKDEFSSLIIPYQQDLHSNLNILESKINNNTNQIKELNSKNLDNINNIINRGGMGNFVYGNNQPSFDNNQYVLRVEYENKITELEHQLSLINTFSKSLKETVEANMIENTKNINENLKKFSSDQLINNNQNNNYLDKKDFDEKIKEYEEQFDRIYSEMNQFQTTLNKLSNESKVNENKINNINEEIKKINGINEDIKALESNINNVNEDLNGCKNQLVK